MRKQRRVCKNTRLAPRPPLLPLAMASEGFTEQKWPSRYDGPGSSPLYRWENQGSERGRSCHVVHPGRGRTWMHIQLPDPGAAASRKHLSSGSHSLFSAHMASRPGLFCLWVAMTAPQATQSFL